MPDEYACQECGNLQEVTSDGETCLLCGGSMVSLNEDLVTMDDHYGQEEEADDFSVDEGYSGAY